MYHIDSPSQRVRAYHYDIDGAWLSKGRTIVSFTDAYPDGMCVDAAGNLWVALWEGGRVVCVDPATATILREVAMPVSRPTSCCFGGEGLSTLYVTSCSVDSTMNGGERNAVDLEKEPLAGSVFAIDVGVAGLATMCWLKKT